MTTVKTTTTAYEINDNLVIGYSEGKYYMKMTNGGSSYITAYDFDEMIEVFECTTVQLQNMKQQLS